MSIRFLIRRENFEALEELREVFPSLDEKLGTAAADKRQILTKAYSKLRFSHYHLKTMKQTDGWRWICPAIEIEAENEKGLGELATQFGVSKLPHLS